MLCGECCTDLGAKLMCNHHPCCHSLRFCDNHCLRSHEQRTERTQQRVQKKLQKSNASRTAWTSQMCKVLDEVAFYTNLTTIILAYSRSINMGPLLNHFIDPGFHVCPFFSIRKVSPCCSFWDTHTTHGFRVCNGLILGWQPTEEEAEEEKEEEAGEEPEGESKAVP